MFLSHVRPPRSMGLVGRLVGRLVGSVRAVQARHGVLHYVPDLPQSRTFGLDSSTKRRSHVGHSHVCATRRRSPVTRRATAVRAADHPRSWDYHGFYHISPIVPRFSNAIHGYRRAIAISAPLRFPRNFGGKRIDLVSLYSVNN